MVVDLTDVATDDTFMRPSIVLTAALVLVGCSGRQQPAPPPSQPTAHLQSLRDAREKLAAQIASLETSLTQLQDQYPDVEGSRDALRHDVQQVSQAYVAAQLERIDAESKYGAGHPLVRTAQKKQENMSSLYQQKLKKLSEADKRVRERDRLVEQLQYARESLRRLDDRIANLEDRAA